MTPNTKLDFRRGKWTRSDEKDALTAEKQAQEDRLDRDTDKRSIASRRAVDEERAQDRQSELSLDLQAQQGLDQQTDSTLDAFFSGLTDMAEMDEEDALTAQEQAGGWRMMDRRRKTYSDPDAGLLTTESNSNN